MADRNIAEELDRRVDAILAGRSAPRPEDPEAAALATVAEGLALLPREDFRSRLKAELVRSGPSGRTGETEVAAGSRAGFHTVTPYVVVPRAEELVGFTKEAFGATELLRSTGSAGGFHAEVRIGDSNVMLGGFPGMPFRESRATLHLYVPDADATYRKALEAGAVSLYAPMDQPYGDREAGVTDPFGNRWFIASHRVGPSHVPEGLRTVTPYFLARDAAGLMSFLKETLAAEEIERAASPDGIVQHATMRIGNSVVEMGEAHGEHLPSTPAMLYLYVDDVDAWYARAVAGGAQAVEAPKAQPYGDRVGHVKDPHDNDWYLATHLGS